MPFLSTIEEEAMAIGIQQGIQQGIQLARVEQMIHNTRRHLMLILQIKFGELPTEVTTCLSNIADIAVLEQLLIRSVTINSLQDFQNILPNN